MSKYIDTVAANHVIGNIYNQLDLVTNEQYPLLLEDFDNSFYKMLYSVFYELYVNGSKEISLVEINDYLENRPKLKGLYTNNNGDEFIKNVSEIAQINSFEYYYQRLKKFTLLRAYNSIGIDVKDIYDPDSLDAIIQQKQNDWLDNHTLTEISNIIEDKELEIRQKFVDGSDNKIIDIGDGIDTLVESLRETPCYGAALYGKYINTITRGARFGELYLISGSTGVGKSRSLVANACMIAFDRYYDNIINKWIFTNPAQPAMFITTEQQKDEIQTMVLAFISGVAEHKILDGNYNEEEYKRIKESITLIKESKFKLQLLSDFSMSDVENTVREGVRKLNCHYIFLDYLHSSIKILSEIANQTKGTKLREDMILFMIADKLKQIAVQNQVFIQTGTQLNDNYMQGIMDQNALRGAKAIADKISVGQMVVYVSEKDKKLIEPLVQKLGCEMPKLKMSVYKNRRGRYQNILLWCQDNRDCCKINPIFVTTADGELIDDIFDTKIIYNEESNSYKTEKEYFEEKAF